jgi:hypothetical protein
MACFKKSVLVFSEQPCFPRRGLQGTFSTLQVATFFRATLTSEDFQGTFYARQVATSHKQ